MKTKDDKTTTPPLPAPGVVPPMTVTIVDHGAPPAPPLPETVTDAPKPPSAPPADGPAKRPVEAWALDKKMLPPWIDGPMWHPKMPPKQVRNPEFWKFAAARAFKAWPEGWEVTEAEFDKTVDEAINTTHQ